MSISYVVTCYNKAAYLSDTLSSIEAERRQSGGEIVIVDDGSTDDSGQILARFEAANPHARVVAQANRGVVGATNSGFSHAGCRAVRFCDADDLLRSGSSRALLEALESTGAEVAFGRHETYRSRPENTPIAAGECRARLLDDPLGSALRRNLFSPSSTILLHKTAQRIFPLPEKYRTSQDYMMGLRASFCAPIARIDATLSLGPEHYEERLSADMARMYGETARFVAEEILDDPDRWRDKDASLALRRNAGRALLWARRNGRPLNQLLKIAALKYAAPLRGKTAAARALAWIAEDVYGVG